MRAEITMKNGRTMLFELYPDKAPITTANFAELARSGFYDGLTFHRVVKDWVIQGGSADNTCDCPHEKTIVGEFRENGIDTGLCHARGALSMARDADFNSAGTQFFVTHRATPELDGRYAAFGQLIEGFDVLDEIANVPTLPKERDNKPLDDQIIARVGILEEIA